MSRPSTASAPRRRRTPGLALAHAGAAVCLFLDERFVEARESAQLARTAVGAQTPRERGHVEALALLVEGKTRDAEAAMRRHLADYPRDLVVFQRTLYEACFRAGDTSRAERYLAERIARRPDHHWKARAVSAPG